MGCVGTVVLSSALHTFYINGPREDINRQALAIADALRENKGLMELNQAYKGKIYSITGPESLTKVQVAEKLAAHDLGHPVKYVDFSYSRKLTKDRSSLLVLLCRPV
jgi:hypothetical protein